MEEPSLDNKTDFIARAQLLLDRDGEKLCAIVKATFELHDSALELAAEGRAREVRFADLPWEKDRPESIAYPADVCLRKPGTDVIFVARACAPGGKPVPSFDVRVEVGPLHKSLLVFGLRLWLSQGSGLSAPAPLAEIDMRYDYAWGGRTDAASGKITEEPRNPIGMGAACNPSVLTHHPAPNIEDPADLIRSVKTSPRPAGIGAIGRSWEPRRRYAGTYDRTWQEFHAPLLPDNFDDRWNLCASPGLVADPPLAGGEPVRLLNLTPEGGVLAFDIPKVALEIEFRIKDRAPAIFVPYPDTVLIDLYAMGPETPALVEMVWRAHVKAPRRMKDARVIVRERVPS